MIGKLDESIKRLSFLSLEVEFLDKFTRHDDPQPETPPLAHIAMSVQSYSEGVAQSSTELVKTINAVWSEGDLVGISLYVRLLFEYWAAENYAVHLLDNLSTENDIQSAQVTCIKLLLGTRYPMWFEMMGLEDARRDPIHVMDFVRALEKDVPGTADTYEFLCEGCHPSYLHQSMIYDGSRGGNRYRGLLHEGFMRRWCEKTVGAAEQAVERVDNLFDRAIGAVTPIIQIILKPR